MRALLLLGVLATLMWAWPVPCVGVAPACTSIDHLPHIVAGRALLPASSSYSIESEGFLTCMASCISWRGCGSVNFDLTTSMCYINRWKQTTNGVYLDTDDNFVYSEVEHWTGRLGGTCYNHSCSVKQLCEVDNDNNPVCVDMFSWPEFIVR